MSQFIPGYELDGLNEQELRSLYQRILRDLRRTGKAVQEAPHVYATLRNIEEAIARLQQAPKPRGPKGPGF